MNSWIGYIWRIISFLLYYIVYTLWAMKTCHFFDYSGISCAIVGLFVPVVTGTNTLQFAYLMARWCHICVTSPVTKLQLWKCCLQFETTMADCFLEFIQVNHLFTTFAESGPLFVLSNSHYITLLANSLTFFPQVVDENFIFRTY